MTDKVPVNLPASVHQRLLTRSKASAENFSLLLTRFALERLLYRLSKSAYADAFVLKGALVFNAWGISGLNRPTRDLDLLGYGDSSPERLMAAFRAICAVEVERDGLVFDADSISVQPVREDDEYAGLRVMLTAMLGKARLPLHVDVGFGDVVVPAASEAAFPVLLDFPAPVLRVYSRESVIAEKLHAMVRLGQLNSRMKDFYDIWLLSRQCEFDGPTLCRAVAAAFSRRDTPLPPQLPLALTPAFGQDAEKVVQWRAFLSRTGLEVEDRRFEDIVAEVRQFLAPVLSSLAQGTLLAQAWVPDKRWRPD